MKHRKRIFQKYGKPSLIWINEAKDGPKRQKKKSDEKFKNITAAISSSFQKQKSGVSFILLKLILDTFLYGLSLQLLSAL
jgi:hypothetical protein